MQGAEEVVRWPLPSLRPPEKVLLCACTRATEAVVSRAGTEHARPTEIVRLALFAVETSRVAATKASICKKLAIPPNNFYVCASVATHGVTELWTP